MRGERIKSITIFSHYNTKPSSRTRSMNPPFSSTNVRTSKPRSPFDSANRETEEAKRSSADGVPSCREPGIVSSPEPKDVILGRGFRYAWHSGNNEFQALVRKNIQRYDEAKRKIDKSRIVQEIYERVIKKGRFLKKDESTGFYEVVEEHVAKEKISQAIRYKRRRSVGSIHHTGASPSSVSSTANPERTNRRRVARQLELFDDSTLQSVLGPREQFEWPAISQFEILTAFDNIR